MSTHTVCTRASDGRDKALMRMHGNLSPRKLNLLFYRRVKRVFHGCCQNTVYDATNANGTSAFIIIIVIMRRQDAFILLSTV